MKPCHWILSALFTAPVAAAPLVAALADDQAGASGTGLLASLSPTAAPASVGADGVPADFDASSTGRVPGEPAPLLASASGVSGVVRFGDTLLKIAERYGITLAELLRLNPGLDTARLVVGSQVRLAQSSPVRTRSLIALSPTGSGGLSWPETTLPAEPSTAPRFRSGSTTGMIWPAKGAFTSGYGWRWGRMHKGIDIANSVGTPIVAVQDGQVTFAGWHDGGYGYLVEVTHPDGTLTRYAHNSALLVREGDVVAQGQAISRMGSTGRSTGPHLHFEILPPARGAANPLQFLPPRA
ncbi:MAG: M23 family metallopeptidase [Cyanobacteriota bacterium]|nr:M23 family metallopeptidase [Cyanobacteriota bacterium]